MRLNKYIAQAGVASRRKADELTKNGNVKVNGVVVTEMGYEVLPDDRVEVNGRVVAPAEQFVYYMMNKPKGFITSMKDEKGRPTVMDLLTDVPERVFPVGRLDYNTTGLLLLTNDGELANKLAHPGHEVGKTYRAIVSGVVSGKRLAMLRHGVDIGGFVTSPAQVTVVKQTEKSAVIELTIHEGKNRQVRKMCKAVGCPVKELQRIAIGDLYLARLMEGHYRKLRKEEVDYLKNL
ncbi:MAG: rRNA pseudouridine synthase [Clostridiales bacterium]|nr:rRNA pseudouridine synthase [Clostridiales bacterium]